MSKHLPLAMALALLAPLATPKVPRRRKSPAPPSPTA